jgi:hypothetical protein
MGACHGHEPSQEWSSIRGHKGSIHDIQSGKKFHSFRPMIDYNDLVQVEQIIKVMQQMSDTLLLQTVMLTLTSERLSLWTQAATLLFQKEDGDRGSDGVLQVIDMKYDGGGIKSWGTTTRHYVRYMSVPMNNSRFLMIMGKNTKSNHGVSAMCSLTSTITDNHDAWRIVYLRHGLIVENDVIIDMNSEAHVHESTMKINIDTDTDQEKDIQSITATDVHSDDEDTDNEIHQL